MIGGTDAPPSRLRGLDSALAAIAEQLRRITVRILGPHAAAGSGVIWTTSGLVVTNAHVTRGGAVAVLSTGRRAHGRLLAWDGEADLAALVIEADGAPAAEIGDSSALRTGELVLAVGNPLGLRGALTAGIVHGTSQGSGNARLIQADLKLAPGNSGGPLADARGRVIGINAMVSGGLALAVPSRAVARFLAPHLDRVAAPP